jgi:hypothetical protein
MENKRALNDELRWLHKLAPVSQAALLLKVAQEARLLHLSLADTRSTSPLARDLEGALEDAMDALPGTAADDAARHLAQFGQRELIERVELALLHLRETDRPRYPHDLARRHEQHVVGMPEPELQVGQQRVHRGPLPAPGPDRVQQREELAVVRGVAHP